MTKALTRPIASSLCDAGYFTGVRDPKWCQPKARYEGLLRKLQPEIQQGAVLCLQEVSLNWTAKLHTFFAEQGYTMVVNNYGQRFNGYMGVAIAFPNARFGLMDADISCVADTKSGGWGVPEGRPPRTATTAPPPTTTNTTTAIVLAKLASTSQVMMSSMWRLVQSVGKIWRTTFAKPLAPATRDARKVENPWELARSRFNTMICLRLRPKQPQQQSSDAPVPSEVLDFLVATYHMPCVFYEPSVMTIHSTLCISKLQALSEGKYPYVIGGDFNFKPNSPQYTFLTTGTLPAVCNDPSDPAVHGKASVPPAPAFEGDTFTFTLPRGPLQSAYKAVCGTEPEFTNHATTRDMVNAPFSHTLDYIFFASSGQKVNGRRASVRAVAVQDLAPIIADIRAQELQSLPSATEPSDHLLLAADLEIASQEA